MRIRVKPLILMFLVGIATVSLAAGQVPDDQRVPVRERAPQGETGWAVGGDFGFQNTTGDDDFDAEPILGGYAEYFPSEHLSWRGMLQLIDVDHALPRPAQGGDDAEILILGGNALYNWHGRQVSPFVTGGLGLYHYDLPSRAGGDNTEAGINAGGGLNLRMTPALSFKFETLIHVTAEETGPDSFVVGTGGVRYGW
jgi:hypothetical protein